MVGNLTKALNSRRGDWIQTFTGRQFWPMDPRPEDIDIEDIAHALAMLCRYGGHCNRFFSVAEHSVLLSKHVSAPNALWALLHDASEAYLVDVPRPIKSSLVGYRDAEDRIMAAVCERFGLSPAMPEEVKSADTAILTDERLQNMKDAPVPWSTDDDPLGIALYYWTPSQATDEFMSRFTLLNQEQSNDD